MGGRTGAEAGRGSDRGHRPAGRPPRRACKPSAGQDRPVRGGNVFWRVCSSRSADALWCANRKTNNRAHSKRETTPIRTRTSSSWGEWWLVWRGYEGIKDTDTASWQVGGEPGGRGEPPARAARWGTMGHVGREWLGDTRSKGEGGGEGSKSQCTFNPRGICSRFPTGRYAAPPPLRTARLSFIYDSRAREKSSVQRRQRRQWRPPC